MHYGPDSDEISADLVTAKDRIIETDIQSVEQVDDIEFSSINSISKSAIVSALINSFSGKTGKFPWELVGLDEPPSIRTSFTVSIDKPERMLADIKNSPYPIIKIKLGSEKDELLLQELTNIPGKLFRFDVNGGWSLEQTEKMFYYLNKLETDIIEQPTQLEHIKEWKYLSANTKLKVFLDEGLHTLNDYFEYADYVDGVNIKMAKSGGMMEAVKLAKQARKDGLKVLLGCMVESSIGIAPAVYMASLADYFDLDGPLLLRNDIAERINFNIETITVDDNIIGGPKIKKEYLND